ANYGVREIMVLRDGVPITDPDSFTRLDFIDTQDIERIEITKGPGNVFALGSTGGTLQIISKSVFDPSSNNIKVGFGRFDTQNYHGRVATKLFDDQALAITGSFRTTDNSWRRRNKFDSTQFSVKHGIHFDSGGTLESEVNYSRAQVQLPGAMSLAQFTEFKRTGKQTGNNNAFKHSGRYSTIWFANSLYVKDWGPFTLKPRFYYNHWSQEHPITGAHSNVGGIHVLGTDLEGVYHHQLFSSSTLVAGITLKQNRDEDSKRFKYADVQTIPFGPQAGRITSTLSDRKGDLIETSTEIQTVYGMFAQETLQPTDDLLIDIGFRLDRIRFDQRTNEMETFNFATGQYVAGVGQFEIDKTFTLFAPRIGINYQLHPNLNGFISAAQGEQVPFSNELEGNPSVKKATVRNYEIGLKGRAPTWFFDTSFFAAEGKDEIVASLVNGQTTFQNAGKTWKLGLEFSGSTEVLDGLWLGGTYSYSHFIYDKFQEVVSGTVTDRSDNHLPLVPTHQYTLFATYTHPVGIRARLQTDTWGSYYVDNANSEQYGGYHFVTSLNLAYERNGHELGINIQNLTDIRYALEVKKDTRGNLSFVGGAPINYLISYRYLFPDWEKAWNDISTGFGLFDSPAVESRS
ncbi:MAG: TonB-dependent receptor, partial [Nitrospirales bacterium]